jgi:hypothetical protein
LNLGYRGIFARSEVGFGLLAVFQPQLWTGSQPVFGLGGAVGPVLAYKRLVIEVPLSFASIQAGVSF